MLMFIIYTTAMACAPSSLSYKSKLPFQLHGKAKENLAVAQVVLLTKFAVIFSSRRDVTRKRSQIRAG